MKNLTSVIFLLLCSNILFSQSTELKYNLKEGKTYKVKSSTVQDQTIIMQGTERKTETKSVSFFSIKMLDPKPDFFIAELKFDTIKTVISMPPMELSSAEKGDITSENPVDVTNCILNRLSNSTLVVRMDYSGHVQDIMNHQIIEKNILAGTDSLKGQAAIAKPQLEIMVAKDALTGMIEGVTAYLPNKEVKKGTTWESSFVSRNGGVGMTINSTYELQDLSKKSAVIEGDVIVEPASTEPMMMNGAEITNKLRGLGKSTIEIDPVTGWIISGSSKMQMSGTMDIKAPGQNMSMPVESLITSETTAVE